MDSCEDVRSTHDDDKTADDVVNSEHPETETVNDHGDELPVVGRAAVFGIVFELAGHPAQFVEYRQQFSTQCIQRRRQCRRR